VVGGARRGVEEIGSDGGALAGRAGRGGTLFNEAVATAGHLCAAVRGSVSRCLLAWVKEEKDMLDLGLRGLDLGHRGSVLGFRGFVAEVPALRW
jgi:hypothetical protein